MRITLLTALLLVVLRLSIGWHFFFEGLHKLHTVLVGPTTTSKPFTSEGYFRETNGPLAKYLRQQIGDPDEMTLARLTPLPFPAGKDPKEVSPVERMPPALNQDWDAHFERFADHYQLGDMQHKETKAKLTQAKANLVGWLTDTNKDNGKVVAKSFNTSSFETKQTVPMRIEEYRAKLDELREVYDKKLPLMNLDVEKANLTKRKAEVRQLRESLVSDLDSRTADMKKDLASMLNTRQKEAGELGDAEPAGVIRWIDRATVWGLTAIGGGLLIGLFTRLNCLLAAGFLAMTYLADPAFPWLPVSPKSEGNYAWVNKNTVEMFALLALATTYSGRWVGLDGLIHWIFFGRSDVKSSR